MNFEQIKQELKFAFSRSSGSGGQHVNKVATKVELRWNVLDSTGIGQEEKLLILEKLDSHVVKEHTVQIFNQKSRSQFQNRILAIAQLERLLKEALAVQKDRKPSHKTPASQHKRLAKKKAHALKKRNRAKVNFNGVDLSYFE